MQVILGLLALLAILISAALITVGGIALIRRGSKHGSGSLGVAMQQLEGLFVESKRHVIHEVRAEEREEEAPAGDPPTK